MGELIAEIEEVVHV
jgi:hypothetical protein